MAFYLFRKSIRKLPGIVIKAASIPDPEMTEGFGSREQTGRICRELGCRSVLLVTDQTLYSLGLHRKAEASLEAEGIQCTVFSGISTEPTLDIIEAGKTAAVGCGADCIVALGGGSVLDSSKIIAAAARYPRLSVHAFLHKFAIVKGKTLPMVSIPSTAGTGAEYTVGAVVKNTRGVKNATVVMGLNVVHVILDSELMVGAPKSVTVWCGVDALSHGLEGVMADVHSTGEDIHKSRECVRLAMENLPRVIEDPGCVEARQKMCLAAHYGGNAINKQLAGYVHAFAHSIGALYHIPHGEAIAHCLLPVMTAQRDECLDALAVLAVYCGFAEAADEPDTAADKMFAALRDLLRQCGMEKGCRAIKTGDYHKLTRMIDNDSINYSPPRTFTDREILAILEHIRKGE